MKPILVVMAVFLLASCSSPSVSLDESVELVRTGKPEAAVHSLETYYKKEPNKKTLHLQHQVESYIQAKQEVEKGNLEIAVLLLTEIQNDSSIHPLMIHLQQNAKELQNQIQVLAKMKTELQASLVDVKIQIQNKKYNQAKKEINSIEKIAKDYPSLHAIYKEAHGLKQQLK
ncbi:hypothetical protein [Bacillus sp. 165]|uniref:hypothetical protein n=1 Tax=Bacillus sp. 165 TaxID=1529117 RepID=UPI001ADCF7E1|nr:hypothetical protein [Bacillus sp. 165]MBO9129883.1 hypothetical protein [Bacillus sp. 165]